MTTAPVGAAPGDPLISLPPTTSTTPVPPDPKASTNAATATSPAAPRTATAERESPSGHRSAAGAGAEGEASPDVASIARHGVGFGSTVVLPRRDRPDARSSSTTRRLAT